MSTNINEFFGRVNSSRSFARPNRFRVMLPSPFGGDTVYLSLMAEQVDLPGQSFSTQEIKTQGPVRLQPYNALFQQTAIVFSVDSDMEIKKFFDRWLNLMYDKTTHFFSYHDEYKVDMVIEQFNEEGVVVYRTRLRDTFPLNINATTLAWAENDNIQRLPVSFSYESWETLPVQIERPENQEGVEIFTGISVDQNGRITIGSNIRIPGIGSLPRIVFDTDELF